MKKAFLVPLFIILSLIGVGAGYFTLIHFVIGDLGDVRVNLVNVTVSRVELDHAVITVTIELVNPAKREVKIDVMSVSLYAGSYYIGDVKKKNVTVRPNGKVFIKLDFPVYYSSTDPELIRVIVKNKTLDIKWRISGKLGINTSVGEIGKSFNITLS